MNTHHIQTINGKAVEVSNELKDFQLSQKESSNVDYFATNKDEDQLFIQFKGGKSYLHEDVPTTLLIGLEEAESVGKYYSANIRFKFSGSIVDWSVKEVI